MSTVERVLLNKENGNLGVGIRVSFFDKVPDFPLGKLDGYSLRLASEDYEGWIIEDALHKCDNKRCVNPDHLYWGTPKENVKDAYERKRARNAKITHCPRGHEYFGDNLYINKGKRYCKTCKKIFYSKYRKEGRYNLEKI